MKNIFDEYSNSERLYPDPFEAPDVPSEEILKTIVENPNRVNSDLRDQVINSVHGKRALAKIELLKHYEREYYDSLEYHPTKVKKLSAVGDPQVGDIYTTKSEIPTQDQIIFTFLPMKIIILSIHNINGNEKIYRGVIVTPTGFIKSSEEVDIDDGWILHPKFIFPVAEYQLFRKIGETSQFMKVKKICKIADIEEEKKWTVDDEKLLDIASYLSVRADSLLND